MFSTPEQLAFEKSVNLVSSQSIDTSIPLKDKYEIENCISWIKTNSYSKVCLQFPDQLLQDSVEVALLIEEQIPDKTYILGDTSYGSCCVDEIAGQHVPADAIIHFGHTCLSTTSRLPVLYVLPKLILDLDRLKTSILPEINEPVIVIYDVGYHHVSSAILECFSTLKMDVIIPELLIDDLKPSRECSQQCSFKETGNHKQIRFSRGFCISNNSPKKLIYIGSQYDPCYANFIVLFKDAECWSFCSKVGLERCNVLKALKQTSYMIEEIKTAESLTIIVLTLTIKGYLEAIDHIKTLAKRWKKRVYILSIGKPTIAKLTNFSEMNVFVSIGCPEVTLPSQKETIQPIVGLIEVELALNENRKWSDVFSRDFRDLLPGGQDYIPCPESPAVIESDISLINGRLIGPNTVNQSHSKDIAINQNKSLVSVSSKLGGKLEKTWFGLEQSLGETPVTMAVDGRSGTSAGYSEEPNLSIE